MKEVLPKSNEPVPEVPEPSVQKKSRLDDDEDNTLADDGQIWSKPLAETREATRLISSYSSIFFFISFFYLEKTNSTNIFKHYFSKFLFLLNIGIIN